MRGGEGGREGGQHEMRKRNGSDSKDKNILRQGLAGLSLGVLKLRV